MKVHVIHVRVNGPDDQDSIRKFTSLCDQWLAQHENTITPFYTAVTPIFGSASVTFTAIMQYREGLDA